MAVGLAVGLPVLLVALSWWWWLPALARSRAERAIQDRLGLTCVVGDVSLRTRGAVLEDVVLEGRHGGVHVEIGELGVLGSPWAMAFDGASAVERVQARHAAAFVDLSNAGAHRSLRAIAEARAPEATGGAAPGPGRVYDAYDLSLQVRDAEGPLIRVRGGTVRKQGEALEVGGSHIVVGSEPDDTADLRDAAASAERRADGWLVVRGSLAGGDLAWADRAESADQRQIAGGHTWRRLRGLVSAFRPEDASAAPVAQTEEDGRWPWLRILAPDVELELSSLTIRSRRGEESSVVMRDLHGSVKGLGALRYRVEGGGATGEGGRLGWDLSVDPLDARGEGTVRFDELPLALVVPFLPDVPWHEPDRARLSGELVVRAGARDALAVEGRVALTGAGLSSPRISPHPIRDISVRLEGEGTWMASLRRLQLDQARITMGRTALRLGGAMEWTDEHYVFDVTATLPPTDCNDAVGAIPTDLLDEVAGFRWDGTIGGRVVAQIDSRRLDATRLEIDVADGCQFTAVPPVADLQRVQGPFLHRVREPDGTWFEMTTGPGTGNWVGVYGVSPFLVHAVLTHEDAGFFRHSGFAPHAIRDALVRNLETGRFVYGASTITMQLVKNLFLGREKNLARKVQEVILAWYVESALDKRDILELYLNVIEYGPGLYGLRNASRRYFGRTPAELSPAEACFLAALLPSPKTVYSQYQDGQLSSSMQSKIRRMLQRMHAGGRIDANALSYGLSEIGRVGFFRSPGEGRRGPRELPGGGRALPFASGAPEGQDPTLSDWEERAEDDGWDPALEDAWEQAQGWDEPVLDVSP